MDFYGMVKTPWKKNSNDHEHGDFFVREMARINGFNTFSTNLKNENLNSLSELIVNICEKQDIDVESYGVYNSQLYFNSNGVFIVPAQLYEKVAENMPPIKHYVYIRDDLEKVFEDIKEIVEENYSLRNKLNLRITC